MMKLIRHAYQEDRRRLEQGRQPLEALGVTMSVCNWPSDRSMRGTSST